MNKDVVYTNCSILNSICSSVDTFIEYETIFLIGFPRISNLAQLLQINSLSEMNMVWKNMKMTNHEFSRREFVFSHTSAFLMKRLSEEI